MKKGIKADAQKTRIETETIETMFFDGNLIGTDVTQTMRISRKDFVKNYGKVVRALNESSPNSIRTFSLRFEIEN